MKKLICLLLALIVSASLMACSGDSGDNGDNGDDIPEINPDLNIGENGEINFPIIPVE